MVRDPADRGELLDVFTDPQRRAGAEGEGAGERGLDPERRAGPGSRLRACGQPCGELRDMADRDDELLLRHAPLHRDHRRPGMALPQASGAVRGGPAGALRHHRRRPGRLLPVSARSPSADGGAGLYRHRPGPRDLGFDGLGRSEEHVEPVRGDAVDAYRLVALVRSDHLHGGQGALGEDPRAALSGPDAGGDRGDRQPLLAGRGGWGALPGVRLPALVPLVRIAAAPTAEGAGTRAGAAPQDMAGTGCPADTSANCARKHTTA